MGPERTINATKMRKYGKFQNEGKCVQRMGHLVKRKDKMLDKNAHCKKNLCVALKRLLCKLPSHVPRSNKWQETMVFTSFTHTHTHIFACSGYPFARRKKCPRRWGKGE